MNHYPKRCVCIVDMHFSNNNKSLHLCQAISNLVVSAVQNVPHTSRHRLHTHIAHTSFCLGLLKAYSRLFMYAQVKHTYS